MCTWDCPLMYNAHPSATQTRVKVNYHLPYPLLSVTLFKMAVARASKKNRNDSEQSTHCWTAIFLSGIKRNTQIRFHARKREENQLGARHATRQKSAMKMVSDIPQKRWKMVTARA